MTIKEAAEGTNIGIKEFYREFKIPEEVPSETKMKDISKVAPDYDFDKIK
ncbi:MAG: 4Fe-4S ferredoxin, partial [Firmicutes bacterium]|nr:4Fe-4S ferredoxin [Bacillota bacterium]